MLFSWFYYCVNLIWPSVIRPEANIFSSNTPRFSGSNHSLIHSLLRIPIIPLRVLRNPFYARSRLRTQSVLPLSRVTYSSAFVLLRHLPTQPRLTRDVNVNIKMSRWIYHVINCFLCENLYNENETHSLLKHMSKSFLRLSLI